MRSFDIFHVFHFLFVLTYNIIDINIYRTVVYKQDKSFENYFIPTEEQFLCWLYGFYLRMKFSWSSELQSKIGNREEITESHHSCEQENKLLTKPGTIYVLS